VTTSNGDAYAHLKSAGEAYEEITRLKAQVGRLQKQLNEALIERGELRHERRAIRKALGEAEKGSPLNDNDVRMLIESDVTLKFSRRFTEGVKIVARRNGRTLTEVSGSESRSLLPEVLRKLRKTIRER